MATRFEIYEFDGSGSSARLAGDRSLFYSTQSKKEMEEIAARSELPYRTSVVVDGADNIIECSMSLVDYSARPGGSSKERYINFDLTTDQNKRLALLLGVFHAEEQMRVDASTPPVLENDLVFQRFGTQLTTLDRVAAILEAVHKPVPMDSVEQSGIPKPVFGNSGEPAPGKPEPSSPLKPAGKRRNLTHRIGPLQEVADPDKEKIGCQYCSGTIQCQKMAKRTQIYCEHHLRVASMKNERRKELKRSNSAVSLSSSLSGDEDYSTLITPNGSPSKPKRSHVDIKPAEEIDAEMAYVGALSNISPQKPSGQPIFARPK